MQSYIYDDHVISIVEWNVYCGSFTLSLCINSTERSQIPARDGLQHKYMLSKIPSSLFHYKLLEHLEAIAHSKYVRFTPTLAEMPRLANTDEGHFLLSPTL